MFKKIIFIFLLLLLLLVASCDYGLPDGDDLCGKWMNPDNEYEEFITFKPEGIGYYELKEEHKFWKDKKGSFL